MPKVRLETASGDYVATAKLPAFNYVPRLVTYDTRLFQYSGGTSNGQTSYREVFAVNITKVTHKG